MRLAVALLLIAFSAQAQKTWYKGNLHTHSYWSDGDEFPEMIIDWYKQHGYQFVGLSDHNTLAEGEKWKLIPKSKSAVEGFERYKAKYGDQWVVFKIDTGRTHVKLKTLNEYRPLFEDKNFLMLKSEEITERFGDKQIHMNATNIQTVIPPQGGGSLQEVMQRNIDAVIRQRKETGVPIMQHLNHPNFYYSITAQNIIDLNGERFFEVYNGHPLVFNYGDSTHPGTERIWDDVNIAYANAGKPLLYGLATDDSHNYHVFGPTYSNSGRGWVMVHASQLTPASLIEAMEAGDFYSSTGVTLESVTFNKHVLSVKVKPEPGVKYQIQIIAVRRGDRVSKVVKTFEGTTGSFAVGSEYLFVRAKITSDRQRSNPLKEDENEAAWTQPVVR